MAAIELLDKRKIWLKYFKEVKNSAELASLVKTKMSKVIINADYILDKDQIALAANRACLAQMAQLMETKGLSTEILFNLSPSTNISSSLAKLGVTDGTTRLVMLSFEEILEKDIDCVKGIVSSLSLLGRDCDMKRIQKFYKISDAELSLGTMLDAIILRIATKEPRRGVGSILSNGSSSSSSVPSAKAKSDVKDEKLKQDKPGNKRKR